MRATLPVLRNPANSHRAISLTADQFRYGFGNAVPREESVPTAVTRSTLKQYEGSGSGSGSGSGAVTDLVEFPDRGHSLKIDHGWSELADATLAWLDKNGLGPR